MKSSVCHQQDNKDNILLHLETAYTKNLKSDNSHDQIHEFPSGFLL
jgi:hypothetical protein